MDVNQPVQLLGGLSPRVFVQRHWQKKPLVIRQAVALSALALDRSALFALAAQDQVESRLVIGGDDRGSGGWRLRHGPFGRRALPALKRPDWTLLVQGVDLYVDEMRAWTT